MRICPHFLVHFFRSMDLLGACPLTGVEGGGLLGSRVRFPTKTFYMVFQLYATPSSDGQLLIQMHKRFFAFLADVPEIGSGSLTIGICPVFGVSLIHVPNKNIIASLLQKDKPSMAEDSIDGLQRQTSQAEITLDERQAQAGHRKYGKLIVLIDRKVLITLGPDYCCFFPAFTVFCLVSTMMISSAILHAQSFAFKLATFIMCGGMCLSYLLVALSNPGIKPRSSCPIKVEEEETSQINTQAKPRKRICQICNIEMQRRMRHCIYCDVCIPEYDHHCPWVSKCIGKGNLLLFQIFVCMVPFYLLYLFGAFIVVMNNIQLQQNGKNLS